MFILNKLKKYIIRLDISLDRKVRYKYPDTYNRLINCVKIGIYRIGCIRSIIYFYSGPALYVYENDLSRIEIYKTLNLSGNPQYLYYRDNDEITYTKYINNQYDFENDTYKYTYDIEAKTYNLNITKMNDDASDIEINYNYLNPSELEIVHHDNGEHYKIVITNIKYKNNQIYEIVMIDKQIKKYRAASYLSETKQPI